MAALLGEAVGQRVGFRVRLEACVGRATRIEVVTEGILLRRLQQVRVSGCGPIAVPPRSCRGQQVFSWIACIASGHVVKGSRCYPGKFASCQGLAPGRSLQVTA